MMKSGVYYIGDLCYVLHHEWDEINEEIIPTYGDHGEFKLSDGREFALYSTLYGDGSYDSIYGSIPVDSGTIGCILLEDIDQDNRENDITLGVIHSFVTDFNTSEENGCIKFGEIEIHTEDEDEESYDDFMYHDLQFYN